MSATPDSALPAPAAVDRVLVRMGFARLELPVPGGHVMWSRGGKVLTWPEALDALGDEVSSARTLMSGQPKHWARTSEFWMAVATLLGLFGGAATVLSGWGMTLAEPWREIVGGSMALAAVWVPRAYTFARARAKAIADAENNNGGGHG